MKVYRVLSQESLGGAYAQEALSRLDSDLLDITKVCMLRKDPNILNTHG